MKVLVYVEGPGDRVSLEKVFHSIRNQGRQSKPEPHRCEPSEEQPVRLRLRAA